MSSPYHDVTPYLTSAGTVGTTTHVRQFHGVYPGIVISNTDPLNQNRITMYVPQFLGTAQSGWAMPMIGILVAPQPGELVYASFMGGDVSQPVYINASQKQLNATALQAGTVPAITFSATQPASGNNGDLWFNTAAGNALSQYENGAWTAYMYGTEAIAASAITAKEIAAGALDAASITAASITAGTLTAATIQNAPFPATSQTTMQGSQISMSSAGGVTPSGTNTGGSILVYQTAPTSATFNGNFGMREEEKEGRYKDTGGTWQVPANVETVDVQMWGGGGGGDANGNGGGGGEYIHVTQYQVSPLSTLTYSVGDGGPGGGINIQPANGNVTTLTGGSINNVPTDLISFGGGAFFFGINQPPASAALGGGQTLSGGYGSKSSNPGENTGGNGGYNSVILSVWDYVNEEYDVTNLSEVSPGGGGGAGGSTGPGKQGQIIAGGGVGIGGTGGAGNTTGGAGGTATPLTYDPGQNDYYSFGGNGVSPGGGGSGAWNGFNEEYINVFGGNGAGGQLIINWQATGPQMIGSVAASAGVDTAGNTYPTGFAGESFQLSNQVSAPYSPAGGALLYGAGGRPWAQSPSGTGLPISSCNSAFTNITLGTGSTGGDLSSTYTIPANDANANSVYKLTAWGSGTGDGATEANFEAFFDATGLGSILTAPPPNGGFIWHFELTTGVTATSGSNNAYALSRLTFSNVASVNALTYTFDPTVIHALTLAVGLGTAQQVICNVTMFERLGA